MYKLQGYILVNIYCISYLHRKNIRLLPCVCKKNTIYSQNSLCELPPNVFSHVIQRIVTTPTRQVAHNLRMREDRVNKEIVFRNIYVKKNVRLPQKRELSIWRNRMVQAKELPCEN